MPTIFDNIETEFLENAAQNGLRDALKVARRGDFCVGYFNLRGWKHIDDVVETWQDDGAPPCRLLVGMQRLPQEDLPKLFADRAGEERIDNKTVARLKRQAAMEFRRQLTIGIPTARDEAGLRKLAQQLRDGKLTVKLYLRHTLHAKLYPAHRDDICNCRAMA
jgi:hypothetical protein